MTIVLASELGFQVIREPRSESRMVDRPFSPSSILRYFADMSHFERESGGSSLGQLTGFQIVYSDLTQEVC